MKTEKDNEAFEPQAKQEWERILEEAMRQVDEGTFRPAPKEDDPVTWDLDELLAPRRQNEPGENMTSVQRQERPSHYGQRAAEPEQRRQSCVDEPSARRRVRNGAAAGSAGGGSHEQTGRTPERGGRRVRRKPDKFQKFRKNRFWLLGFLWLSFVYSTLVVRLASDSSVFFKPGAFLSLLFAVTPALLFFVLFTISRKPRVNRTLVIIFSSVVYLLYASQLVYYKVFLQYYTFSSMGNAAQGFGFMSTILVTIGKNILWLMILALPLLFVVIFGKRFFSFKGGARLKGSALLLGVAIVWHIFTVLILPLWGTDLMTPYDMYHYTYDVKDSAAQLGLGTAFRLDAKWTIFGTAKTHGLDLTPAEPDGMTSGDTGDTQPDDTQPDDTQPSETQPQISGDNILDIDFEALAAAEGDSDIRNMHLYFNSMKATNKNEKTGMFEGCNLILITAESFSHIAVDPELTPTLYKMKTQGFNFTNFYTPIWGVSTSDGEYVAMTGTIPKAGVWSFYRTGEQKNLMPLTMCAQLKELGYSAYGYHNHDYDYYDRDLSHPNMGYIWKGMGNGMEEGVTKQWPESDVEMIDFTTSDYISQQPFHAYYMTVSGHKEYNFKGGNKMSSKNQALVENLPYSDEVKAYLATQIELDRAMELLLQRLEEAGVAENTVIVISADHYPYGLTAEQISEREGHTIDTEFEMYRNALIIYKPGMTPETVDEICCSMDILPTLSNLFGLEYDSRLYVGHDIFSDAEPLVIFQNRSWMTDKATYNAKNGEVTSLTGEEIPEDYVTNIKRAVSNKFTISANILDKDYWRILFGTSE